MYNTIILKHGKSWLAKREYKSFEKGDTIWGADSDPEEVKRWSAKDEEAAKAELAQYNCSYRRAIEDYDIEEYALEYCECDENGEFVEGSDFDFAEEK